ncbi:protein PFC0760c-like [Saccostrea echinata]|uniref:protein PFC0760c-like n=1 Tax=Saccostrea echinata TaxID=191078 RepID=UPI002A7ED9EC|nr:protein PFC0760c-like [Saccostrea echinata]
MDNSKESGSESQEISEVKVDNSREDLSSEENTPQYDKQTEQELHILKNQVSDDVKQLLDTVFPGVDSKAPEKVVYMEKKHMQNPVIPTNPQLSKQNNNFLSTIDNLSHGSSISGFASTELDSNYATPTVQENFNAEKSQSQPMFLNYNNFLSHLPNLEKYPDQKDEISDEHFKESKQIYYTQSSTTPYSIFQQPYFHGEPLQETLNLKPVIYNALSEELPAPVTFLSKKGQDKDITQNHHTKNNESSIYTTEDKRDNISPLKKDNLLESDASKSSEEDFSYDYKFDAKSDLSHLNSYPSNDVQDYYENNLLNSDQSNAEEAVKIIYDLFNDYDDHLRDYENEQLNFEVELYPTSTLIPISTTQNNELKISKATNSDNTFTAGKETFKIFPSIEVKISSDESEISESREDMDTYHKYNHEKGRKKPSTDRDKYNSQNSLYDIPHVSSMDLSREEEVQNVDVKKLDENSSEERTKSYGSHTDEHLERENGRSNEKSTSHEENSIHQFSINDNNNVPDEKKPRGIFNAPVESNMSYNEGGELTYQHDVSGENYFITDGINPTENGGNDSVDTQESDKSHKSFDNSRSESAEDVSSTEKSENINPYNSLQNIFFDRDSGSILQGKSSKSSESRVDEASKESKHSKSKDELGEHYLKNDNNIDGGEIQSDSSDSSEESITNQHFIGSHYEDIQHQKDSTVIHKEGKNQSGEIGENYQIIDSDSNESGEKMKDNGDSSEESMAISQNIYTNSKDSGDIQHKSESISKEKSYQNYDLGGNYERNDNNFSGSEETDEDNNKSTEESIVNQHYIGSDSNEFELQDHSSSVSNEESNDNDEFGEIHEKDDGNLNEREETKEKSSGESISNQIYSDSESKDSSHIQHQKDNIAFEEDSESTENKFIKGFTKVKGDMSSGDKSISKENDEGSSSNESKNGDSSEDSSTSCEGEYCNSYGSSSVKIDFTERERLKNGFQDEPNNNSEEEAVDQDDSKSNEETSGQNKHEHLLDYKSSEEYTSSITKSVSEEILNFKSSEEQNYKKNEGEKAGGKEQSSENKSLSSTSDTTSSGSSESFENDNKKRDGLQNNIEDSDSDEYFQNHDRWNGQNSHQISDDDDEQVNENYEDENEMSKPKENKDQSTENTEYSPNISKSFELVSSDGESHEKEVKYKSSEDESSSEGSHEQVRKNNLEMEEDGSDGKIDEQSKQNTEETTDDSYENKEDFENQHNIIESKEGSTEEPEDEFSKKPYNSKTIDEESKEENNEEGKKKESGSDEESKDKIMIHEKESYSYENSEEEPKEEYEKVTDNIVHKNSKELSSEVLMTDSGEDNKNDEDTHKEDNKIIYENEAKDQTDKNTNNKSDCKDKRKEEDNSNKDDISNEKSGEIRNDDDLENAVGMISEMFLFDVDKSKSGEHNDYNSIMKHNTPMKYSKDGRVSCLLKILFNLQQQWLKTKYGSKDRKYHSKYMHHRKDSSDLRMKLPTLKKNLYEKPRKRGSLYGQGPFLSYKLYEPYGSIRFIHRPSHLFPSSYNKIRSFHYDSLHPKRYVSSLSKYLQGRRKYLYDSHSSNLRPKYVRNGYGTRRMQISFGNKRNYFGKVNNDESRIRKDLSRLSHFLTKSQRDGTNGSIKVNQGRVHNRNNKNDYDPYHNEVVDYVKNIDDDTVVVHPLVTRSSY